MESVCLDGRNEKRNQTCRVCGTVQDRRTCGACRQKALRDKRKGPAKACICGKPAKRSFCSPACSQRGFRNRHKVVEPILTIPPHVKTLAELKEVERALQSSGIERGPAPRFSFVGKRYQGRRNRKVQADAELLYHINKGYAESPLVELIAETRTTHDELRNIDWLRKQEAAESLKSAGKLTYSDGLKEAVEKGLIKRDHNDYYPPDTDGEAQAS